MCAVLFTLVTWQVAADGPLLAPDERAGRILSRPHSYSPIAEFCADLGNAPIAVSVLGAAICWAAWRGFRTRVRRWWLPPLAAALAMGAVPAVVVPLKLWIGRPGLLGPAEGYGWYPSGHAATATVAYGMAALLLAAVPRRRARARRLLAAAAVLLNLVVAAGLIRRGYHWPLDVLASWLLFGALLYAVSRPVLGRAAPRPHTSPAPEPSDR
ncbi:phosphatase PAP2 family protein [Streptomyces sp. NPDC004647]|uniref:phosphatase PAP2 family protein n=1 Tax=Streptomyces sp. NPDC004647 TaxID=3154671 RepID=UPI0033A55336